MIVSSGIPELDKSLGGSYGPGLHIVTGYRNTGVTRYLFKLLRQFEKARPAGFPSYFVSLEVTRKIAVQELQGTGTMMYGLDVKGIEDFERSPDGGLLVIDQVSHIRWASPMAGAGPVASVLAGLSSIAQKKKAIIIAGYSCSKGANGPPQLLQASTGTWDLEALGSPVGKRGAGLIGTPARVNSAGTHAVDRTFIFDPAKFKPTFYVGSTPGGTAMKHCIETKVYVPGSGCECGAAKIGFGRGMVGHSSWCPWVKQ